MDDFFGKLGMGKLLGNKNMCNGIPEKVV